MFVSIQVVLKAAITLIRSIFTLEEDLAAVVPLLG